VKENISFIQQARERKEQKQNNHNNYNPPTTSSNNNNNDLSTSLLSSQQDEDYLGDPFPTEVAVAAISISAVVVVVGFNLRSRTNAGLGSRLSEVLGITNSEREDLMFNTKDRCVERRYLTKVSSSRVLKNNAII